MIKPIKTLKPLNIRIPDTLRKQLEVINNKLNENIDARKQAMIDRCILTAEHDYLNATQAEVQLRDRLAEAEAQQADVDRKLAEYESIEQDVAMLEREYAELASFTGKLQLQAASDNLSSARQIGTAQKPRERDWDQPVAASVGIAAVPIGFGVLLILCRLFRKLTQ